MKRCVRSVGALGLAVLGLAAGACVQPGRPVADSEAALQALLAAGEDRDRARLELLAIDFYGRIANRRFNSVATYQDPALREFFQSLEAWSDYYAELVQRLEDRHFEANRPTRVEIQEIRYAPAGTVEGAEDGAAEATIRVRMVGENGLPLRFWRTSLVREDRWRIEQGRWWVIPAKL